jgi:hypothetical protein
MRPFEVPTPQQFRDLRDWLIAQGMTAQQATAYLGSAPQGRAIGTLADELRVHLKTLPKA